ncbi:hypothetical protein F5Y17DRAFT_422627 [Xylariaceae sp. FL0594]|nr:hypothetical protein F5Y17DRAFT_422627 [Xylariaceae sp. FL0594]
MVTRKPVPDNQSTSNTTVLPRIELWSATDSEVDTERIWDDHDPTSPPVPAPAEHDATGNGGTPGISSASAVPGPLRPGIASITPPYDQAERNPWDDADRVATVPLKDGADGKLGEVPDALRPGAGRSETNPFKRKPVQATTEAPPSPQPPVKAFSRLRTDEPPESVPNPWETTLDAKKPPNTPQTPSSLIDQDPDKDVWSASPSRGTPSPIPISAQSTGDSEGWNEVPPSLPSKVTAVNTSTAADLLGDEHAWGDEASQNQSKQSRVPQSDARPDTADGWNLVDHDSPVSGPTTGNTAQQSTGERVLDAGEEATPNPGEPPSLPSRNPVETQLPPPSSRHSPTNINMSETYQIKVINWQDSEAARNPRQSPILVQNANGPCPLLALVNALTLTTPADRDTALVETLRSREQISLSFLLDNVLEELISHRHSESKGPLPDMSELYAFLQGLHTGMNVNPRFIPTPEAISASEPTTLSHVQPPERASSIPGTFEKTRDMELYATFSIPLIHGWLPLRDQPVYGAMRRHASSYDDAQNLLFREEELEQKFSTTQAGLTGEEQQLYQDIITIKSFLSSTATQLTPSGLDVITNSITPGGIAILFRNDHFSTLYRHPQTLQLFTLVTDAGYVTHDEVVWESLVDVRGERAEFFSGDFRVVGGAQHQRADSSHETRLNSTEDAGTSNGGGWQTVQSRRSRANQGNESVPEEAPLSPHNEQEDRDLALALQLQEEEEERHRTEQAARRRASQLSERFIEQQAPTGNLPGQWSRSSSVSNRGRGRGGSGTHNSLPPPRGSSANQTQSTRGGATTAAQARGGRTGQTVRSLIPPMTHRPADEAMEDAPPSYEQAAKTTPYVPPAGHPSHPGSDPRSTSARRSTLSLSAGSRTPTTTTTTRPSQQRHSVSSVSAGGSAGGGGATGSGAARDRDCSVM